MVQGIYQDYDHKVGIQKCKTYPSLFYIVNELRDVIFVVYVDATLGIGDKSELMDKIECIKK